MNCASYATLLDGYVDGVLTPQEHQAVAAHLATCPTCAQYVEDCLAMAANFPTTDDVVVPDGFAQSVMTQVAQHPRKTKKTRQWQRFALPMVACLALVIYAGGTLSTSPESAVATPMAETAQMAEPASRAVAESSQPEVLQEEAIMDSAFYFPQSQVGERLNGYTLTPSDDGNLHYILTPEEFLAFVADIEPNTPHWPEQATYQVVVIDP